MRTRKYKKKEIGSYPPANRPHKVLIKIINQPFDNDTAYFLPKKSE